MVNAPACRSQTLPLTMQRRLQIACNNSLGKSSIFIEGTSAAAAAAQLKTITCGRSECLLGSGAVPVEARLLCRHSVVHCSCSPDSRLSSPATFAALFLLVAASLALPSSAAFTDALLTARAAGPLTRLVSGFERGIWRLADRRAALVRLLTLHLPPRLPCRSLLPITSTGVARKHSSHSKTAIAEASCTCMRPSVVPRPRLPHCCLRHSVDAWGSLSRSRRCVGASDSNKQLRRNCLARRARAASEQSSASSDSQGARQGTALQAQHEEARTNRLQQALNCRHFEQCSGCTLDEAAAIAEPPIAARARQFFGGVPAEDVSCAHSMEP